MNSRNIKHSKSSISGLCYTLFVVCIVFSRISITVFQNAESSRGMFIVGVIAGCIGFVIHRWYFVSGCLMAILVSITPIKRHLDKYQEYALRRRMESANSYIMFVVKLGLDFEVDQRHYQERRK